jgi:hypothetical protein
MEVVGFLGDVALGGDGEEWKDGAEGDAEQKESHASQHPDLALRNGPSAAKASVILHQLGHG